MAIRVSSETPAEPAAESSGRARSKSQDHSDFAAISYIWIRLKGRASRLRRQLATRANREKLLLNEPCSDSSDHLARVSDTRAQGAYDSVAGLALLRRLARCLTEKELALLHDVYWDQTPVYRLCEERRVSKNSILKMKRNALAKLRRASRALK